jgi:uncharacterized protein (DUF697 family)
MRQKKMLRVWNIMIALQPCRGALGQRTSPARGDWLIPMEGHMATSVTKVEHTIQPQIRERVEESRAIVRRNVMWAMGAGMVPMPIVDVFAISAVQLKMAKELGDHYKIAFRENRVKSIVSSLIGGFTSFGLGSIALMSLMKVVPVAGQALGSIAVPVAGGAVTHALGQVFIQHFETGGTFLDFDPLTMREYFRKEFESAKETVKSYQSEKV